MATLQWLRFCGGPEVRPPEGSHSDYRRAVIVQAEFAVRG
jgi:hypothetical protein